MWCNALQTKILPVLNPPTYVNHFPGSHLLTHKDQLYSRLRKVKCDYFPESFVLPRDDTYLLSILKESSDECLWITKPPNIGCGKKISILTTTELLQHLSPVKSECKDDDNHYPIDLFIPLDDPPSPDLPNHTNPTHDDGTDTPNSPQQLTDSSTPLDEPSTKFLHQMTVSRYISRPLVINQHKVDLRIYVLVTQYSPLESYVFQEGLVRFASEPYEVGPQSRTNRFVHLTNNSVSDRNPRNSEDYRGLQKVGGNGRNWSLKQLALWLKENKHTNFDEVWKNIKKMISFVLGTLQPHIVREIQKSNWNIHFFELYGFDVLLDDDLHPWLLEINSNPSIETQPCTFNTVWEPEQEIHSQMVAHLFNILFHHPLQPGLFEPLS
eukprot:TRINITY_DN352_c0_g1_i1.p1 TRINITY_DN352_c0_g1~~TRINITY_DN352_c0_g1_i1.p1  ORF type:complete len:381 (+),score=72.08 TRINITY_DN352_c0_g1_i1:957-2099(+)